METTNPAEVDQIKREAIPTRSVLKTDYLPMGDLVMVIPLPSAETFGTIIIPNAARQEMNEGHIIDIGNMVPKDLVEVGDCICWPQHSEYRMEVDGGQKFVLIKSSQIIMRITHQKLEQSKQQRTDEPLATGA